MPVPRWLKVCWQGTHLCGRGVCTCALWTLWLLLGLSLGIQIFILSSRELAVPGFLLREIESRLEAAGLRLSFGSAKFDPGGHVLLRQTRLSLVALDEPIFQADSIYLELNPLTLWFRDLEPRQVRIGDAELLIPSVLSPSGTRVPLVQRLDASLRPGNAVGLLHLDHLTALVGPIPVDLHGAIQLPKRRADAPPFDQLLQTLARDYLQACRLAADTLPQVPPLDHPRLSLYLQPDPTHVATIALRLQADSLDLPTGPLHEGTFRLHHPLVTTRFDLGRLARLIDLDFTIDRVELPGGYTVDTLVGQLQAMAAPVAGRFEPRLLDLSAVACHTPDLSLHHLSTRAGVATLPHVQAHLHAQLFGEPAEARLDLDLLTRAGRVRLDTRLDPALLSFAAQKLSVDLPALLQWTEPPRLSADLNLGSRGQPLRASATVSTGPVIARGVALDATAARLSWQGTHLRADEILLLRGASRATGSYEMDIRTLDFRFLLGGRLAPSDIDGWFKDWWPRFWSTFDFSTAPPDANVEVSGRWKAPLLTQVWVQASGRDATIKDIALDSVATRLFVRPGWADVLEFRASRPPGEVRGSFTRSWRLPLGARWTGIEIHAEGTSDLSPLPKLLGELGERIAAPFTLTEPFNLRLDGRVERADWDAPVSVDFKVAGHTSGEWTFFNFPLHGAEFLAHQTNERLLVAPFSAGVTRGALGGRIELSGPPDAKRLAFDLNLEHAHLGETIRTFETWTARRRGEEPKPESDFQQRIAEGELDLSLSAEGPAGQAYDFRGQGAVSIEDANLGELKLLGPLSTLLDSTLLNFSTLQLDNAYGDFVIAGRRLDFDNIKLTGRRGAIDADGKYYLDTRNLDFLTRVRPFDGGGGGLLDTVFAPLTHALEVKLGGKLTAPQWTFVFGPTNILRTLTGSRPQPDAAAPEPHPPSPPPPAP